MRITKVKTAATGKSNFQSTPGILIAIGGKENKGEDLNDNQRVNEKFIPYEILERFCQELKGKRPLIAIIPTASGNPQQAAQDYVKVYKKLKHQNIQIVNILNREGAASPETNIHQIATGVPSPCAI